MNRLVFVDGAIADDSIAVASPLTRHSGEGAFEVFRTHKGRLPTLRLHLERLAGSLVAMKIPCDLARVRRDVETAASRLAGDVRVDVHVERTASGVRDTVIATELAPTERVQSVSAATVSAARATRDGHKVIAYGAHGDALAQARSHGCSDALLVDSDGLVREAATANVFAVVGGVILTAPDRILPGITRRLVLELAASVKLTTSFRALSMTELLASDEVFLTSSVRGIASVKAIDGIAIGVGNPVAHAIAQALQETLCKTS